LDHSGSRRHEGSRQRPSLSRRNAAAPPESRQQPTTDLKDQVQITPFISLAAGVVDRDVTKQTNVTHGAFRTALEFACTDYTDPQHPPCPGWIFICGSPGMSVGGLRR